MRVLVCGSRDWVNFGAVWGRFRQLPDGTTIVHGAANGADTIADMAAATLGFDREPHPANWKGLGKAAGPIRNNEMLDSGIDLVLAFPLNNSRGTQHTIDGARKRGIPVEVFGAA